MSKKQELSPRTHNLLYLIDIAEVELGKDDLMLLSKLNQFYLSTRYPGERVQLSKAIDINKAQEFLKDTKEVWECLKEKIV